MLKRMLKLRSVSWLGLLFVLMPLYGQGYEIEISFKGLSGDTVILGEYFTSRMIPKDTIVLDNKGRGVFEGAEKFKGGMYLIYIDQNHFFDFLIDKDQVFSIETDTSDFVSATLFQGSEDNELFHEYKTLLASSREKASLYKKNLAEAANQADSAKAKSALDQLDKSIESYYAKLKNDYPNHFVTIFIAATRDPVAPESILKGTKREIDSIRYMYYIKHYLDNFDVGDVRLLHSPLYENKIKTYISRVVPQHPDSLVLAVDYLIEESRSDEEIFRYMLITLFNHFAESKFMGMDVIYFHIAEKYYIPEATWSDPVFLSKLEKTLEENKPTLIGQKAPNLVMRKVPFEHFQMAALDTAIRSDPHIGENFQIHDIQSNYTILYFWEADCGHCKKSTPALYESYQRLKELGVEVIAVHAINSVEGKEKWVDFVNQHEMYDWINCWSPYSNDFRISYNLQSFPQLFILDASKKIIARKISPEQAEDIITKLYKLDQNNNTN